MLVRQRRTFDVAKRREVIFEIQRYLAKQQYYVQMPSGVYVGGVGRRAQELRARTWATTTAGGCMAAWLDR